MNKIYQKSFLGGKNAGFTLIELLVVVLIIGILAAVALPKYERAVKKAQFSNLQTMAEAILRAQEVYKMANGIYSFDFNALDISLPADMKPHLTTADGRVYAMQKSDMRCMFASTANLNTSGASFVACTSTKEPQLIYYITLASKKRYCGAKTGNTEAEEWCKYLTQKQARSSQWGENSLYLLD